MVVVTRKIVGLLWFIHCLERSRSPRTAASSSLPRSCQVQPAPMAGTCDVKRDAVMRCHGVPLRLSGPAGLCRGWRCAWASFFATDAVAIGTAEPPIIMAVFLFGHAGPWSPPFAGSSCHRWQPILAKSRCCRRCMHQLRSRRHGLLLLFGHRPFVQIGARRCMNRSRFSSGLHQAHAELVEPVTLRLFGIKDDGAGHVEMGVCRVPSSAPWVLGPVKAHGVGDQQLCCSSAVGAMCGMKSTSRPSSGMWSFRLGCGQSVPYSARWWELLTTRRARAPRPVGVLLAVQRLGAGDAQALGQLTLLRTFLLAHEPGTASELRSVHRFAHIGAGPMWSTTTVVGRQMKKSHSSGPPALK